MGVSRGVPWREDRFGFALGQGRRAEVGHFTTVARWGGKSRSTIPLVVAYDDVPNHRLSQTLRVKSVVVIPPLARARRGEAVLHRPRTLCRAVRRTRA